MVRAWLASSPLPWPCCSPRWPRTSAARAAGAARWRAGTVALRARLAAAHRPSPGARFEAASLEGLPPPVVRYFRTVLRDGQPLIEVTRLRHTGTFDMGKAAPDWKPFVSDQVVTASPPGFDWDATIAMAPGLARWSTTRTSPARGSSTPRSSGW